MPSEKTKKIDSGLCPNCGNNIWQCLDGFKKLQCKNCNLIVIISGVEGE